MKIIKIILNLPWSIAALIMGLLSGIKSIGVHKVPPSLVINVRSFWFRTWRKENKGTRGNALGNVVLLGPNLLPGDLEHELVHVEQGMREPFVYPILYWLESRNHGYRKNKYEVEAYTIAKNTYLED